MIVGILSDTHGHLDERMIHHLSDCDEIWHAGDWLSIESFDAFNIFEGKNLRAVYGNVDGHELRVSLPENNIFNIQGINFLIRHIVGKPDKYYPEVQTLIRKHQPKVIICGHSHIALVQKNPSTGILHINPGAAGKKGFHKFRTMVKLEINEGKISNVRMIELEVRDI